MIDTHLVAHISAHLKIALKSWVEVMSYVFVSLDLLKQIV